MSTNTENEKKSEELTSKNEPENNDIESREYHLAIRCIKSRDGVRSCEIRDITVIMPHNDVKTPEVSVETAEKKDTSDAAPIAPAPSRVPDEKADDVCSLCDVIRDALKESARAPAPRRLPPSMRPRRMIRA